MVSLKKLPLEVLESMAAAGARIVECYRVLVNDLKAGAGASGDIGLYIDNGSEGFFRNLRLTDI